MDTAGIPGAQCIHVAHTPIMAFGDGRGALECCGAHLINTMVTFCLKKVTLIIKDVVTGEQSGNSWSSLEMCVTIWE